MFKSPTYLTTKGKNNALINCFVGDHDLLCSCNNPAYHCLQILATTLAPQLKQEEKQQIIQCLGGTDAVPTTRGDEEIGLEDLEKLFTEDTEEDAAG